MAWVSGVMRTGQECEKHWACALKEGKLLNGRGWEGHDPLYQRDVTCGLLLQARPATLRLCDMWKYEVVCQQSEALEGSSEGGGVHLYSQFLEACLSIRLNLAAEKLDNNEPCPYL